MITRLLRKNISLSRILGFVLSDFIGLAIVLGALQFYLDARSIWESEDSFVKSDYLIINKKVTSSNMLGYASSGFSDAEISEIESQPWSRRVGRFSSNDFRVAATVKSGERGMSTYMFFESIPDDFIDVPRSQWQYQQGSEEVPIILSKDYLTLYNFGFAASVGLPQLSEGLMSSIPLHLRLTSEDGSKSREYYGRVAGFSNKLNTILVPQSFMDESNRTLGTGAKHQPSRLIIDVSSPGDVAIKEYMESHDLEIAGDKSASSSAFLLRVVVGIVLSIGAIITILSLFVLMLSISLIMERNRSKIHSLLMLGYETALIGRTYNKLIVIASVCAFLLAIVGVMALRASYIEPIMALGANPAPIWVMPVMGLLLTSIIIVFNIISVRRRIRASFRN